MYMLIINGGETMGKDQKIRCEVESCKHQNEEERCCKLSEIKEATEEESTICRSFECDSNKLKK